MLLARIQEQLCQRSLRLSFSCFATSIQLIFALNAKSSRPHDQDIAQSVTSVLSALIITALGLTIVSELRTITRSWCSSSPFGSKLLFTVLSMFSQLQILWKMASMIVLLKCVMKHAFSKCVKTQQSTWQHGSPACSFASSISYYLHFFCTLTLKTTLPIVPLVKDLLPTEEESKELLVKAQPILIQTHLICPHQWCLILTSKTRSQCWLTRLKNIARCLKRLPSRRKKAVASISGRWLHIPKSCLKRNFTNTWLTGQSRLMMVSLSSAVEMILLNDKKLRNLLRKSHHLYHSNFETKTNRSVSSLNYSWNSTFIKLRTLNYLKS